VKDPGCGFTKCVIFVPIGYPILPPPQDIIVQQRKNVVSFWPNKFREVDVHVDTTDNEGGGGCVMVFNATFNNISVISWRSVLLVEDNRVHKENHRPLKKDKEMKAAHYLICNIRILYEYIRGRRSRDRIVVGFTTTYAISAYHH
jgi:hypothetical protein